MEYEDKISYAKSLIASNTNDIIIQEQVLGGRGESSIIRYY